MALSRKVRIKLSSRERAILRKEARKEGMPVAALARKLIAEEAQRILKSVS